MKSEIELCLAVEICKPMALEIPPVFRDAKYGHYSDYKRPKVIKPLLFRQKLMVLTLSLVLFIRWVRFVQSGKHRLW